MPTPAPSGRMPSVFDYQDYAFLTGAAPITQLILVRHGEPRMPDAPGPIGDVIDPLLSDRGERQAELVGKRLASVEVDAVYSSALHRARRTGEHIAQPHGLEPVVIDDLREVEVFGQIPPEQSVEEYLGRPLLLGVRERMMFEKSWDVYPFSEGSAEFRKRVVNTMEAIVATHEGGHVVVACHGGVINAYIAHHIGIAQDMFFRPAHASVQVVLAGHHNVRALHSLGDVHHLLEAGDEMISY